VRCPRCGREQEDGGEACRHCGLFFAKFRPRPARPAGERGQVPSGWSRGRAWLRERMFQVSPCANRPLVVLRALGLMVLAAWGLRLLAYGPDRPELMASFLHWIHLPFHEAGHVVFSPFGEFLHILGGTMGQLLVPLVVLGAFLRQEDPFGASFGAWWLGTSLMDCAPYVNDARARVLPLISGVTGMEDWEGHDWYQILSRTGLLAWDHRLARCFWLAGVLVVLGALVWGGYVLVRQWGFGTDD